MQTVKLTLQKSFFEQMEKVILESGALSASTFLFSSGVHGLRVKNAKGELILLPYQGQQIWRASFCGKDLTMKSTFREPVATQDFGSTYGCFLLHCGMTAMGNPGEGDTHPQHGELPNIPYDSAYVAIGEDEGGRYVEVGGDVRYRQAFAVNYTASPKIKLYERETLMDISMTVANHRAEAMEYLYLCHVNFHPVEGAKLVYSAPAVPERIKVHKDVPVNLPADKAVALRNYMDRLSENPALQNVVDSKSQVYDPEIVFTVKYDTDAGGWAHCMQVAPTGEAFYVSFRPDELPYGIRWIGRTAEEDAMGMALPATAEHKGYNYCKANGQIKWLAGKSSIRFHVKAGYLEPERAGAVAGKIQFGSGLVTAL